MCKAVCFHSCARVRTRATRATVKISVMSERLCPVPAPYRSLPSLTQLDTGHLAKRPRVTKVVQLTQLTLTYFDYKLEEYTTASSSGMNDAEGNTNTLKTHVNEVWHKLVDACVCNAKQYNAIAMSLFHSSMVPTVNPTKLVQMYSWMNKAGEVPSYKEYVPDLSERICVVFMHIWNGSWTATIQDGGVYENLTASIHAYFNETLKEVSCIDDVPLTLFTTTKGSPWPQILPRTTLNNTVQLTYFHCEIGAHRCSPGEYRAVSSSKAEGATKTFVEHVDDVCGKLVKDCVDCVADESVYESVAGEGCGLTSKVVLGLQGEGHDSLASKVQFLPNLTRLIYTHECINAGKHDSVHRLSQQLGVVLLHVRHGQWNVKVDNCDDFVIEDYLDRTLETVRILEEIVTEVQQWQSSQSY
jgi:hypothetical protein